MIAKAGMTGIEYLNERNKAQQTEANFQANRQRAIQARDVKIQSINRRMIQEHEAASQTKLDMQIAALENAERRAVVAGEAGLGGGSTVDNFIADPEIKRLRAETQLNSNLKDMRLQAELDKMGVSAETENRVNSLPRGQEPNFLSYAAKAGAQVYGAHQAEQALLPENIAKQQLEVQQAMIAAESFVGAMPAPKTTWQSITSFFD